MMEMEEIHEMLVFNSALTQLIIEEDFRTFAGHESFKSYIVVIRLRRYGYQSECYSSTSVVAETSSLLQYILAVNVK
jgi:hypothetical protein